MQNSKKVLMMAALPLTAMLVWFSGCHQRSATEKRYDLKGKVVAVDKDKRLATISHEDIKGYMPGMVMPFLVKDEGALQMMKPGDLVQATLVVDGRQRGSKKSSLLRGAGHFTTNYRRTRGSETGR